MGNPLHASALSLSEDRVTGRYGPMDKAGRTSRRRPLGVAAVFLLAAVAGVVGNHITGRVTPALAVFAALVASGMAITYVLDRKAMSHTASDRQEGDPDGKDKGAADLRGAQGVQIGDQNRQQNYFGPGRDA